MNLEFIILLFLAAGGWLFKEALFEYRRKRRRDYYRNVYLKSEAWKRKRFVVLKRDNWKCVYCGKIATRFTTNAMQEKIGKEPTKWLVSVCKPCHEKKH